jgi:pyruvate,water dikinase
MVRTADRLAQQDFASLSDPALAEAIGERVGIQAHWLDVYWKEFIPFAHGMRLFGQMYNDALRPEDPYAFMDLLGGGRLVSLERNRLLEEMAVLLREDPSLKKRLKADASRGTAAFEQALDRLTGQFGDLSCGVQEGAGCVQGRESVVKFLLEMADHPPARKRVNSRDVDRLTSTFLSRFEGEQHTFASEVLDLARASYRLRDDDNIYLGRIEKEMLRAVEEGKRRLKKREEAGEGSSDSSGLIEALRRIDALPILRSSPEAPKSPFDIKARQMVGQPAGPGIARGRARVILNPSDLFDFKAGEILVCDALDPNMTFVVPVASGIVERRGGMLIHGAIIAREYGLPCVTGVPNVTSLIHTGEVITVDGFLGIVIVG